MRSSACWPSLAIAVSYPRALSRTSIRRRAEGSSSTMRTVAPEDSMRFSRVPIPSQRQRVAGVAWPGEMHSTKRCLSRNKDGQKRCSIRCPIGHGVSTTISPPPFRREGASVAGRCRETGRRGLDRHGGDGPASGEGPGQNDSRTRWPFSPGEFTDSSCIHRARGSPRARSPCRLGPAGRSRRARAGHSDHRRRLA